MTRSSRIFYECGWEERKISQSSEMKIALLEFFMVPLIDIIYDFFSAATH